MHGAVISDEIAIYFHWNQTETKVTPARDNQLKNQPNDNLLLPNDVVWKQKNLFWRIFSVQYCHNSKNFTRLETIIMYLHALI